MEENFESDKKKLFRKYLNDTCTREELARLYEYLQQSDDRQEYQEVLEDLWKRLSAYQPMESSRADEIFRTIVNHAKTSTEMPRPSKQVGWPGTSPWRKIAAVFIGSLIVAGLAYQYMRMPDTITFSTAYGETQEFELPDNSKVVLNGNSSLTYLAEWEKKGEAASREVWLEGEAYFEVRGITHEAHATENAPPGKVKFTVHTSHLNVEVLGTAFNVHNHRDKTQVVLSSGKVKLNLLRHDGLGNVVMNPGDLVEFNAKNSQVQQKIVNPALYSSWKDHQLMFEDTPVSEITQILQERYGFDISLQDKDIGMRKFTGTVSTNQIELLLKAMASSFNLEVIRNGKQITIQYP